MAKSEQKVTRINLRLSESEAKAIRDRAQASGLSLSAYMRHCALFGNAPSPVADARDLKPLYTELRRCGNNVNQIARAINSQGTNAVPGGEISQALASLREATESVAQALVSARNI